MLNVNKLILGLLSLLIINLSVLASECQLYEQYNPNKYKESNKIFTSFIIESFNNIDIFKDKQEWKSLGFIHQNQTDLTRQSSKSKNGLSWFRVKNNKIIWFKITKHLDNKYYAKDIAKAIYKKFPLLSKYTLFGDGSLWSDGNQYFIINNQYFEVTYNVNSNVEHEYPEYNHSVITYSFLNNTKNIIKYKECKKQQILLKQKGRSLKL